MWSLIKVAYNIVFYTPLLKGLLFFTSILPFHDLGLSVIVLTIAVKLILFPFTHKSLKIQQVMKKIEPEIKRIQGDGKNKEEQAKALMELYRAHGINPFSGFFMIFLQLPILIALYQIFWKGLKNLPLGVNTMFLGFILLTKTNVGMAALAAISQFWQAKLAIPSSSVEDKVKTTGQPDVSRMMQKQMVFVFPFMIFFIALKLPSAVSLYWTSMNLFAIVHEAIVRKKAKKADLLYDGRETKAN